MDTLLQVTALNFVIAALLTSFNSLSLHQHGFSILFILGVVLGEHGVLMRFNNFDPRLL